MHREKEHNRYGYTTRVMLRQKEKANEKDLRDQLKAAKTKEGDLRGKLNRRSARSEERMSNDCKGIKEAIRRRWEQRSSSPTPRVIRDRVREEKNRPGASREGRSKNRSRGRDASRSPRTRRRRDVSRKKNRRDASNRSRSPRDSTNTREPGARDVYRRLQARQDGGEDDRVRQERLEEEKMMNEERRTLWLEEELRRTALLEEEEKRHRQRREEDEACRKRQMGEDEERKKLFMMEITDVRETIQAMLQDKIQEALQNIMPFFESTIRKSSE